jgi:hypothetical protein
VAAKRSWLFGIAIVVAPSLAFLALAVVGLRVSRESRSRNVTALDRAQVVTAADLGVAAEPSRELLQKTEEDNGSLRLTYRYPSELLPDEPVSVECIVVRALDAVAAKKTLADVQAEVRRALAEKPGALPWGDESRAGVLLKDGRPVGTFFAARQERFVFVLRITGQSHEPDALMAVMRPKLEQLTRFGEVPGA